MLPQKKTQNQLLHNRCAHPPQLLRYAPLTKPPPLWKPSILGVKFCEIFRFGHPNPGKRSTRKISRQISRHLWQRRTEKHFTPLICSCGCCGMFWPLQRFASYNRMHVQHPRQTQVVSRTEGSFSFHGVSTRGVRHSPAKGVCCKRALSFAKG